MGQIDCPETSVHDYQSTLHKIPEEFRSHLHRDTSLKSRVFPSYSCKIYFNIILPSTLRNSKWCPSLPHFPASKQCVHLFCHVCYTCHSPFTLPELSTPIISATQYKSLASHLHYTHFLHPSFSCFFPLTRSSPCSPSTGLLYRPVRKISKSDY